MAPYLVICSLPGWPMPGSLASASLSAFLAFTGEPFKGDLDFIRTVLKNPSP